MVAWQPLLSTIRKGPLSSGTDQPDPFTADSGQLHSAALPRAAPKKNIK